MSDRDPPTPLEFAVSDEEAGDRLDHILKRRLPRSGRRAIAALFADRAVLANGRPARKGELGEAGARISVTRPHAIVGEPAAPLRVVLETPWVLVVSKPAGQPSVPLRPGETGTLAAALLGKYPELSGIGYRSREPGLIHRLDTSTSGLLVAARTDAAFRTLAAALGDGRLSKRYLAVVEGAGFPESGRIDAPLRPEEGESRRVAVDRARGRPAITTFRVVSRTARFALVECDVSHAYRHQIRVHLAHLGHPIVGDETYGGSIVSQLQGRHALHASYVAWTGDDVVPGFEAEDPLPADLGALLAT